MSLRIALLALASVSETGTASLTLQDVLTSVEVRFPPLVVAREKVEAAKGARMSADGAFDLKVKGKGGYDPLGYYGGAVADVALEQPTRLWGISVYGGYRYGDDFPIYAAKSLTGEAGELRLGVNIPLWQGGPIDEARLGVTLAELGVDVAGLERDLKGLEVSQKAAHTYWKWVAAGRKLEVDRGMLRLAEARRGFVESRVARGDLAALELVDNDRLVADRQAQVVASEAALARAALALSMFLRDEAGDPVVPAPERLPPDFPEAAPVPAEGLEVLLAQGLAVRPELARLERVQAGLRAELAFQENQRAPALDLKVEAAKDLGDPTTYGPDPAFKTRGEAQLGVSLAVTWPVEQRKARGKAAALEAKLRALEAEQGFLRDGVRVQIREAHVALEAARRRAELVDRTYGLTQALEQAERRKLELGQTNIFVVNLREEATAKAAKERVEALAAYHLARADLAVAAGDRP
ncbi:MAG: TolC family protein [Deltaproteobacteria bacterium]|nr:TolC family protein [Deltaproteobacteria bacterium]